MVRAIWVRLVLGLSDLACFMCVRERERESGREGGKETRRFGICCA